MKYSNVLSLHQRHCNLEFTPYLSSITIVDQYLSPCSSLRPVCKTTTPPTCHPHFVGRVFRVFRWDRRRSLASHRSGLNRTSIWAFGHFSSKPLVNVWWFFQIKSVHDVLMFYVLFYIRITLWSLFFQGFFPQKGHCSDVKNLGSVYGLRPRISTISSRN